MCLRWNDGVKSAQKKRWADHFSPHPNSQLTTHNSQTSMPLDQGTVNVLDFGGSANKVKQASNRAPPTSKGAQKMPTPDGKTGPNGAPFQPNPNVTQTATTSSWSKGDYTTASLPSTIGDVIMGPTPVPTTTLSMSGGGLSPYSYEAPATYTPPVPGVNNNTVVVRDYDPFNPFDPNNPNSMQFKIQKMVKENSSKSKEEQFADFQKEFTRIYHKYHPQQDATLAYETNSIDSAAELSEIKTSLLSQGYNFDYVEEFMYPLYGGDSHGMVGYDNSVAPVTDPEISKRAFNYALDLWNKTDGTVYYDPNDPLFLQHRIENNRGPKNATEIAAELVNKGWSKEEADKATTAAYDEYQYQQSILIEETTQKSIAALSEQQNKMWGAVREATDQAYQMFVDGSTKEEVRAKILKQGEVDVQLIDNYVIPDAYDKYQKGLTFGDKTLDGFGKVVDFWAEGVGTLFAGYGKALGLAGEGLVGGVFGNMSFTTILLVIGGGIIALIVVFKYVL